ncbi:hypothetical protein [Saccharopolyspora shandongensis]|uniref:hypothetical protein n=1 Tax=Saccharopolyspora shandongensis TaxID=418495 RepID=UPI0033D09C12
MMRTALRGALGLALALPLLFGVSALSPAALFAVSPAPAVASQLAPQEQHHHRCIKGDKVCEEHQVEHVRQHHSQSHGQDR